MRQDPPNKIGRRDALGLAATAGAGAVIAAPASAQTSRVLTVALTSGDPAIRAAADRLGTRLRTASAGGLDLRIGDVVQGADAVTAVSDGSVDGVLGLADAFMDVDPAFGLFCSTPFGLGPREFEAWIYHGGGQADWDELAGTYGMKSLLVGDFGPRPVGWFNAPLDSAATLSGQVMNTRGLGEVAARAWGAQVVTQAASSIGGDVFGTDSFGLAADLDAGLNTRFAVLHTPAALRPHRAVHISLSRGVWDFLSEAERMLLDTCCMAEADYMCGLSVSREMTAFAELTRNGVVPVALDPAVFADLSATATTAVADEIAGASRVTPVQNAYTTFLEEVSNWTAIGESAFSVARARALGI